MLRTQVVKLTRASPCVKRSFSITALRAAEGDTGSVKQSGSSDAWGKREAASENKFIRDKERESLQRLREKLAAQRKHLDELDSHIKELEGESRGEQ